MKRIKWILSFGLIIFLSVAVQSAHADEALNRALMEAVDAGDARAVESLLSRGADSFVALSELGGYGQVKLKDLEPVMSTALSMAIRDHKNDIAISLANHMDKFITPFTWGNGGKDTLFALNTAVSYGDVSIAEILIKRGASIANTQRDGRLLFNTTNSVAMVDFLLAHGADINAKNNNGDTSLHLAVLQCEIKSAELLLTHGANANLANANGETPLHLLGSPDRSQWKNEEDWKKIAGLLISHGADINAKDKNGLTPLARVAASDSKGLVEMLQSKGAMNPANPRMMLAEKIKQFKGHSDNDALRRSIIELVKKLKPTPAIPQEAQDLDGRAQYIFKNAKSEDDYLEASKQYLKAIEGAPWVPYYYYNLCVILEKTPFYKQALHACRLYLEVATDASGEDGSKVRALISGLQYAKEKTVAQMKERTAYLGEGGADALYRFGGISGSVAGKDMALKIMVDWKASPPKHQVFYGCIESDGVHGQAMDMASIDMGRTTCKTNINMHLVIKPDGEGFVELSDWGGNGSIRTTLEKLFEQKRKALEKSPIFESYDSNKAGHYYTAYVQGGNDNSYAGYSMYECDCNGNVLRKDARALPDDFVSQDKRIKNFYSAIYGNELENLSPCDSLFWRKTDYSGWGVNEK